MTWQPGDLSPDARRAAEAAADAAGVPLADWFADAVRAAIIRELGSIPAELAPEPEATPELADLPEPVEPPEIAEVPEAAEATESSERPEAGDMPETVEAQEPTARAREPDPVPPVVPLERTAPQAPAPAVVAPKPAPAVAPIPFVADYGPRRISLEAQRLSASGLTGWLASKIEGPPTNATAAARPPGASAPTPRPSPLDLSAPPSTPGPMRAPTPPPEPRAAPPLPRQTTSAPLPPLAHQPAGLPPRPEPAPLRPAEASPPSAIVPLSLPSGPVFAVALRDLRPARIRSRRPGETEPTIAALTSDVLVHGVREPVLVRRLAESSGSFEVVAGERRRLAAERTDRSEIPAVLVEANDAEALTLSLAENLGRGDFSPLDEARAYLRLLTEYRVSPAALAQRLARERSHIALALRLLGLPAKVRQSIDSGRLNAAQCYALLNAADPETLAEQMMESGSGGAA